MALQQRGYRRLLNLPSEYLWGSKSNFCEESMPLIQVLLVLIVVGVLLWLVNNFIPMAGSIKSILNAVVVICVVVWLLNVFGLLGSIYRVHVPR